MSDNDSKKSKLFKGLKKDVIGAALAASVLFLDPRRAISAVHQEDVKEGDWYRGSQDISAVHQEDVKEGDWYRDSQDTKNNPEIIDDEDSNNDSFLEEFDFSGSNCRGSGIAGDELIDAINTYCNSLDSDPRGSEERLSNNLLDVGFSNLGVSLHIGLGTDSCNICDLTSYSLDITPEQEAIARDNSNYYFDELLRDTPEYQDALNVLMGDGQEENYDGRSQLVESINNLKAAAVNGPLSSGKLFPFCDVDHIMEVRELALADYDNGCALVELYNRDACESISEDYDYRCVLAELCDNAEK